LDIIVDRMRREFKVEVNQGEPQVEYKEAITRTADHREGYKKQSGGRGKFADIVFTIGPADEVDGKVPNGLQFVNEGKGGNVRREDIPSDETGFKEAITRTADHREVYEKQSGGRGKFADIVFTIGPADEVDAKLPNGLQFVNEVKGGNVPRGYIPSVEKGFKEAMKQGPLAGFEMDSMKVTLKDGSYHAVDSDSLSFELAAKMGYKEAAKAAGAVILEPIMKLEVITPEENMGDIVGDLNRRRGQVNDMGDRAGAKVIKASVPLSEMFGYVTTLRTLSSGRATSTMEFSHYAETPSNISDEVI